MKEVLIARIYIWRGTSVVFHCNLRDCAQSCRFVNVLSTPKSLRKLYSTIHAKDAGYPLRLAELYHT